MNFKKRLQTALEALTDKRLAQSYFLDTARNCHCALGAIMAHEKMEFNWDSFRKISGPATYENSEAEQAMQANDSFTGTPEERHAHMLKWSK